MDEKKRSGQEIDCVEERCLNRAAALEAARRLLADNAHRFGENITVDAEVVTELEWANVSRRDD